MTSLGSNAGKSNDLELSVCVYVCRVFWHVKRTTVVQSTARPLHVNVGLCLPWKLMLAIPASGSPFRPRNHRLLLLLSYFFLLPPPPYPFAACLSRFPRAKPIRFIRNRSNVKFSVVSFCIYERACYLQTEISSAKSRCSLFRLMPRPIWSVEIFSPLCFNVASDYKLYFIFNGMHRTQHSVHRGYVISEFSGLVNLAYVRSERVKN